MATNATIFVFIENDGVIAIFSAGQQSQLRQHHTHVIYVSPQVNRAKEVRQSVKSTICISCTGVVSVGFPRRGAVDIAIGQPIQPIGTDRAAAVGLQRAARDAVLRLSGEPDVE